MPFDIAGAASGFAKGAARRRMLQKKLCHPVTATLAVSVMSYLVLTRLLHVRASLKTRLRAFAWSTLAIGGFMFVHHYIVDQSAEVTAETAKNREMARQMAGLAAVGAVTGGREPPPMNMRAAQPGAQSAPAPDPPHTFDTSDASVMNITPLRPIGQVRL